MALIMLSRPDGVMLDYLFFAEKHGRCKQFWHGIHFRKADSYTSKGSKSANWLRAAAVQRLWLRH